MELKQKGFPGQVMGAQVSNRKPADIQDDKQSIFYYQATKTLFTWHELTERYIGRKEFPNHIDFTV